MQLQDDILENQPGHLLAGCRAGTIGVGTVVFAYLVAHFSTMVADLRVLLADRAVCSSTLKRQDTIHYDTLKQEQERTERQWLNSITLMCFTRE